MSNKRSSRKCLIIIVLALICSTGKNAKANFIFEISANIRVGLAAVNIAATDTWTQKADMPTARELCSAGVVNEKIYVIGGWDAWMDPTPFATVEVYDPATDTWESKADMPTARGALATAVVNGKIYAIGGGRGSSRLSTVEVYDPATDTWEKKANMQMARWFHSAAVVDGKIYAIGSGHSSAVEVYEPATDTWTRIANLPANRWVCGTGVVNGRIYAIGGAIEGGQTSSVIEYDPAADSWTQKANMPTASAGLSAAVVDGKIYAIGGSAYFNGPGLAMVEVYDPATDTWEKKADMPTARLSFAVGVVNGRIYAIGGAPVSGQSSTGRCLTTVYEYEPGLPPPDFNGDFKIDIEDLIILIEHWGQDEPSVDIAPRPSGDGIVDVQDLEVFMSYWGQEFDDPRLVAHWKLDEIEGDIAYDSAGDKAGLLFGGPVWRPAEGKKDGALEFDGFDDHVITDSVLDPADGSFSVFAWIKDGAPGQVILSQESGVNWLMADLVDGALKTDLKKPATTGRDPSPQGPPLTSSTVVTNGDWHRIGFVWDGSNRILYVDDIEVTRDTATDLEAAGGGLYIGAGSSLEPSTYFSGLIDDIRIYNKALSAEEIAALAQ